MADEASGCCPNPRTSTTIYAHCQNCGKFRATLDVPLEKPHRVFKLVHGRLMNWGSADSREAAIATAAKLSGGREVFVAARVAVVELYPLPPVQGPPRLQGELEAFVRAGQRYLTAAADGEVCEDRSCLRCRTADLLFELEARAR